MTSSTFSRLSLNVSTIRSVSVGINRFLFLLITVGYGRRGVDGRFAFELSLAAAAAEEVFAVRERARELVLVRFIRVDGSLANGIDAALDQDLCVERLIDGHEDHLRRLVACIGR